MTVEDFLAAHEAAARGWVDARAGAMVHYLDDARVALGLGESPDGWVQELLQRAGARIWLVI